MALIALAAACSSDDTAIDRPDTTKGAISMQAAINDGTRVSFATAGEDTKGLKVSWQTSDCVTAFAAQGASTGQFAVSNISTDGHSATLTGNLSPEVTAATMSMPTSPPLTPPRMAPRSPSTGPHRAVRWTNWATTTF